MDAKIQVTIISPTTNEVEFSGGVSYVEKNISAKDFPRKVSRSVGGDCYQAFLKDPFSKEVEILYDSSWPKKGNYSRALLMEEDEDLFERIKESGKILILLFGNTDFLKEIFFPAPGGKFHMVGVFREDGE
jgi:hypothetical protein